MISAGVEDRLERGAERKPAVKSRRSPVGAASVLRITQRSIAPMSMP
jgi:hypothetical protein